MKIFVPKETHSGETRAAFVPATVKKLCALGAQISVEPGIGSGIDLDDAAYAEAGASLQERQAGLGGADLVACLRKPSVEDVAKMREGAILAGLLEPFSSPKVISALASRNISAISMEMLPRTTLAQKMDALSSQANLAGYVAVILAAERLNKILPMMMTPAGDRKSVV